jgi:hypothetical protein
MKRLPPIDLLRETFDYDPATGAITWKVKPAMCVSVGSVAGRIHVSGYRHIMYKRKVYKAARLAYALHYGIDPYPYEVDHINRNRHDDAIENLRLATRSVNCRNQNLRVTNTSTCKGVSYNKREKKWCAHITIEGHRMHLGWYKTFEAARDARLGAEARMLQSVTTP